MTLGVKQGRVIHQSKRGSKTGVDGLDTMDEGAGRGRGQIKALYKKYTGGFF
jgi:hypothetical protein